jgi:hypothetical protein
MTELTKKADVVIEIGGRNEDIGWSIDDKAWLHDNPGRAHRSLTASGPGAADLSVTNG